MAVNEGRRRIVGGVDTHKDLHVAAVGMARSVMK